MEWIKVRRRYIPATIPLIYYFTWDVEKEFGVKMDVLQTWENGDFRAIWKKQTLALLGKSAYNKLLTLDLDEQREKGLKAGAVIIQFCEDFLKNISKKNVDDYITFFNQFEVLYHQLMVENFVFWLTVTPHIEQKLKVKGISDDIVRMKSHPSEKSYSALEEERFEELVKLFKAGKAIDKEVDKFVEDYFWFPFEYVGPEMWTENSVKERIRNYATSKRESVESKEAPIYDSETEKDFRILQKLMLYQDDRKMMHSQICCYVNGIVMKHLSELLNIPFKYVRYIDVPLLQKAKTLNILENLKEREKLLVQYYSPDGNKFYVGKEARKFLEQMGLREESYENVMEVQGVVANPGICRGRVRVLKSNAVDDFKDGNILVTGMTTPDFTPLVKICGAIVTDEGGITCHAAIVSREMKKPCVIGTKIATKVFKDGDMVEVDADKGVVRKVE